MFNAFELVMLLVSMFSLVTEEKQKTVWFLLEIVFSYDLTTGRFPMTRQRYEAVLQLIGPLSELAACRGIVRDNAAEPTFMEAHGILCVILKPILGSLTVAELEEIHLSADEAFQVLFKPLDGLKSTAKSWGRRAISDERFSLWIGACDTDILDAFSPKTNSVSTPPIDLNPKSYEICSAPIPWSSNIAMDDRTAVAIFSFGASLTRVSPQHNEHVKNLETKASRSTMESTAPVLDNCLGTRRVKTLEHAINDNPLHKTRVADTSPEVWWTTATLSSGELKSGIPLMPGISPYGIRQPTDIHHPYLPMAPPTPPADHVQDAFPVASDPIPAASDTPNYPTLPLHIIKRKPGISDLHTIATTSSHRMNMARSVAQDNFMQRHAFKAVHSSEPKVRSNSLEPHTAPNEARWIIPIHANTSVHVSADYEGYLRTPYGADIYHVLESLSLVVPSTSAVTSSPDSYPCTQRSAGPNDAWWTIPGSTRATFPAHTTDNLPRHRQVYGIVPDHVLESLSLLAPSTASLSPSTPATSLPPTPLLTPQCSADDLPFSGWAAKWESDQHSLWSSALKDERRQFNEQATRPPQTKMTTKKAKSFRQRLGALWSH